MNQIGLVEAAGIIVVLALIAWPIVFFQIVRPRIMARIGRRLNVDVHESTGGWDAGLFDTEEGAPLGKSFGVMVADLIVTLTGVVGVIGAVTAPLFLLVESGLPYRWEGQLTSTAARIGDIVVAPMTDSKTTVRVAVRNEARDAMRSCRLNVAGYTGRNGYLNGASNYFDLAPAARETVDFELSVLKPVPGTHAFRINLECGTRVKDSAASSVEVRE